MADPLDASGEVFPATYEQGYRQEESEDVTPGLGRCHHYARIEQ